MDSFFDGNLFSYLIPIVLIILFSLPDALRKKRKYPKRTKPVPPPESRTQTKQSKPAPQPVQKRQPVPAAERNARPQPVRMLPKQPKTVPLPAAVPAAAVHPAPVPAVSLSKPLRKTGDPWSGLSEPARDLYAGIIWSELLQPPLAHRRKKR